jgi:hypothetical protein
LHAIATPDRAGDDRCEALALTNVSNSWVESQELFGGELWGMDGKRLQIDGHRDGRD